MLIACTKPDKLSTDGCVAVKYLPISFFTFSDIGDLRSF